MKKRAPKKIIGRRETVDFPELGLFGMEVKIDTGAYTSAIHCNEVTLFEKEGREYLSFVPLDPEHVQFDNRAVESPLYKTKQVKNSFGQTEERFVIKTKIAIYGEKYDVELSLADRSAMDFPVLLGRKALKRRFLVDVSKVNCSIKRK
jgi:hypothetical protein